MCESTRGEWGKRCPDCKQMLPKAFNPRAPLSWMARRNLDAAQSAQASRTLTPEQRLRNRVGK